MNEMENIDLFDKFYKNQLSAEESISFEKELESNANLKNEYNLYLAAIEVIKIDNLKKEVASFHQEFKQNKTFKFPVLKIASVIVFGLLAISGFWINATNGTDLIDSLAVNYVEPQQRGGVEEKKLAETLYLNEDWEGVIEVYTKSGNPDGKLSFLTAMAHFRLKDFQNTNQILSGLETADHKYEIEFYKGQSLVGLGKYKEALEVFDKMSEGNPYQENIDWKYRLKLKLLALKP